MNDDERLFRDLFLSEMWRSVPEIPRHLRAEQRKVDRAQQRELEFLQAEAQLSTQLPQISDPCAQRCAQNGCDIPLTKAAEDGCHMEKSTCRPKESTPERGGCDTNAPRGLAS